MFTGIVEKLAEVKQLQPDGPGIRLGVDLEDWTSTLEIGESIAVNGCCLTVISLDHGITQFEAGEESLAKTTLGALQLGDRVNIERAMRADGRLGGHLVTGHVDTVGTVSSRVDDEDWSTIHFEIPSPFELHLVSKGSITINGVSLTVVEVDGNQFSVALIPHTLEVTTLGPLQVGDRVNLETDVLAKYVERQLESRLSKPGEP